MDGPLISADALQSAMRREFQSVPTTCPAGFLSLMHVRCAHFYYLSVIIAWVLRCRYNIPQLKPVSASVLLVSSGCVRGAVVVCGRVVRAEVRPGGGVLAYFGQRAGRQRHRVREGVPVGADAAAYRLDAPPPQPRPQPGIPELLQTDTEAQAAAAPHTFNRWDGTQLCFHYRCEQIFVYDVLMSKKPLFCYRSDYDK